MTTLPTSVEACTSTRGRSRVGWTSRKTVTSTMIAYAAPRAADSTMVANPVQMAAMMRTGSPMSHFAPHTARSASSASNRGRGALLRMPTSTPYAATRTIMSKPGTRPPI